jgi:hypothetical protein
MNKVNGKVLVKETGGGVSNLLVIIHDVDPMSKAKSSVAQSSYQTGSRRENRIGPVHTNTNGNLELAFDNAIFAPCDSERSPDLVPDVFATDNSISTAQFIPLHLQQHLLFFSNLHRQDAGQTEACILRVSRELLEKFEANASNGTASLSQPLPFSPGRNGFIPAIALGYNSGGGNGLFGLGWDLGYPSIQRKTGQTIAALPRWGRERHHYVLRGKRFDTTATRFCER